MSLAGPEIPTIIIIAVHGCIEDQRQFFFGVSSKCTTPKFLHILNPTKGPAYVCTYIPSTYIFTYPPSTLSHTFKHRPHMCTHQCTNMCHLRRWKKSTYTYVRIIYLSTNLHAYHSMYVCTYILNVYAKRYVKSIWTDR